MPTMRIDDFSGGVSQGPANGLLPSESAVLRNWYPSGKKLRRRRGIQAITFSAAPTTLREFVVHQTVLQSGSVDQRYFVCGTDVGFVAYDAETNVWVTLTGAAVPASTEPWTMRQYKGAIYALRRGSGLLVMRAPFSTYRRAGISAPNSASTVATEVAGSLPKGVYEYVFTFRNSTTAEESVRSAAVRKTSSAANKTFDLTVIPQPPAGSEADEIRIWRSLVILDPAVPPTGDIGEYRYLDTIPVGQTTYSDTTLQDGLGDVLSIRNGTPPSGHLLEVAQERAFIADNGTVYWSEPGLLSAFYGLNFLPVFPEDGQSITALHFYDAMNALLVGKQSRIVALVADGSGGYARQEFASKIGVASQRSMRSIGGVLMWFGGDNFYRSDNGEPPQSTSTLRLRDAVAGIPANRRSEVVAALRPQESQYIVSIPTATSRAIWVYNWATNCWSEWTSAIVLPTIRESVSEELGEELYAIGSDSYIYEMDKGEFDIAGGGTQSLIAAVYRSRQVGAQKGGMVARRVGIECSTVREQATLSLYGNDAVLASSRTIPLDQTLWSAVPGRESRYKLYAFAPNDAADHVSVQLEYSGRSSVEIESVEIEVAERAGRAGVVM